jgi:hypothetical protein
MMSRLLCPKFVAGRKYCHNLTHAFRVNAPIRGSKRRAAAISFAVPAQRAGDPSLIRIFSGAMDEYCLFSRALNPSEIRALDSAGKPQPDPVAALNKN